MENWVFVQVYFILPSEHVEWRSWQPQRHPVDAQTIGSGTSVAGAKTEYHIGGTIIKSGWSELIFPENCAVYAMVTEGSIDGSLSWRLWPPPCYRPVMCLVEK
jgi:hypothetical protein